MKKAVHTSLKLPGRALTLLLLLSGGGEALARASGAGFGPTRTLVDYCFITADYSVLAETLGANVTFTFHPLGATAGGNLAIIYLRQGPTGAYPGYTMVKNAAGDFVFTKAIASGIITSVYFTYEVGPGGVQQTSVTAPHTYTVGTSCRTPSATATRSAALSTVVSVAPNPAAGHTVVLFAPAQATAFETTLYDLKGALVKAIGAGRAEAGKPVALPLGTDELAPGIYLVKLQTDYGVATARLVLSR